MARLGIFGGPLLCKHQGIPVCSSGEVHLAEFQVGAKHMRVAGKQKEQMRQCFRYGPLCRQKHLSYLSVGCIKALDAEFIIKRPSD